MSSTTIDIATINAMLEGTTIAPITPPQAPAQDAPAWMSRPASQSQIGRIIRAEEAILASGRKRGIALIERHHGEFANAGTASTYYKSLATFTRKHNIQF